MRRHAERVLAPYWPLGAQTLAAMTPEQRQALDRSKRLQARKDPRNRAAWAVGARRGGAKVRELYEAGLYQPPLVRRPELVERQRRYMLKAVADPAYRAALVRRLSTGAREAAELVEQTCVVCGTRFQTGAALVRAGQGKTCSPTCYRTRRAQVLSEHRPATTAPAAWRQRTRLSARAQWHQNPRYQRIAAALRTLDPSRLASLPQQARQMLGWYYGLDQTEALDYRQIAERRHLGTSKVTYRLHRLLAHVLGSDVVHARRWADEIGAAGRVAKPLEADDLLAEVRRVLGRAA